MDRLPALWEARAMLENLTPLKSDCGKRCGHACCQSPAEEEQGMLLFPGEADYYRNREGYRLVPCAQGTLLICPGRCRREERSGTLPRAEHLPGSGGRRGEAAGCSLPQQRVCAGWQGGKPRSPGLLWEWGLRCACGFF